MGTAERAGTGWFGESVEFRDEWDFFRFDLGLHVVMDFGPGGSGRGRGIAGRVAAVEVGSGDRFQHGHDDSGGDPLGAFPAGRVAGLSGRTDDVACRHAND